MIGASRLWRARAWPEERLADILLKLHAGTAGLTASQRLALDAVSAARGHLEREAGGEAVEEAEKALTLFREENDPRGIAEAQCILVKALYLQEEVKAALRRVHMAIDDADAAGLADAKAKLKLRASEVHLAAGDIEKAKRLAQEAKESFSELQLRSMADLACLHLARVALAHCHQRASLVEASRCIDLAVASFKESEEKLGLAYALSLRSEVDVLRRRHKKARTSLYDASELASAAGDKIAQATFMLAIARSCSVTGQHLEALRTSETALSLLGLSPSGPGSPGVTAEALLLLAQAHCSRDDVEKALAPAAQWVQKSRRINHLHGIVVGMLVLTHVHLEDDDPRSAEGMASEACSVARESDDLRLKVHALQEVAGLATQSPGDGLELALEAREVAEELGDWQLRAASLVILIDIYMQMRRKREVTRAAKQLLGLVSREGMVRDKVIVMVKISNLYLKDKQHHEALKMAKNAKKMAHDDGDLLGQARAGSMIADVYMVTKKHEEAVLAAMEAARIYSKLGDLSGEAQARTTIAEVLVFQYLCDPEPLPNWLGIDKKWPTVLDAVNKAERLARKLDDDQVLSSILLLAARASEKAKMTNDALQAAMEAIELCEESDDVNGEAAAHMVCSRVHLQENNPTLAEDSAKRALELYQAKGSQRGMAQAIQAIQDVARAADPSLLTWSRAFSQTEMEEFARRLIAS